MAKRIGLIVTAAVLVAVLGCVIAVLAQPGTPAGAQQESEPPAQGLVEKKTIEENITGPGKVESGATEKLKAEKWRYFSAFVAPLNTRIAAGTPLVEYTYGGALVAPYDLVVTGKELPKQFEELTEDYSVEVSRVDVMHIVMDVYEKDLKDIAIGQGVNIVLNADEANPRTGEIVNINEVGTYASDGSKYQVTIEVSNESGMLIGMSANLSITVSEVADVLAVPVSAISNDSTGSFVEVVRDDTTTERVPVQAGLSDGSFVEVTGELAEGDSVVLHEAPASDENGLSSVDSIMIG